MLRPIRVGIIVPFEKPSTGGGFEFQYTIFSEVLKRFFCQEKPVGIQYIPIAYYESHCIEWGLDPQQCFLLHSPRSTSSTFRRLIRKARRRLKYKQPQTGPVYTETDKQLRSSMDVIWSLSTNIPSRAIPYLTTVWDLQHRLQPFFPEVSEIGSWSWQSREDTYLDAARRSFACIVGTRRGHNELVQFYGIDSKRILINPFPCPAPLNSDQSKHSDILSDLDLDAKEYLLYPAQFWTHKNHLCALYALKLLLESGHRYKLVLPGSNQGSFESVKEKTKDLDIEEFVRFPGFVTRSDLAELYRNSFALIYPSFFGPDNIPPLEAMSYEVPALVSNVPGSQDQLSDHALYFDPCKPEELTDLISSLSSNSNLRNSLIQRGSDFAKSLTASGYIDNVEKHILKYQIALECASLHRL